MEQNQSIGELNRAITQISEATQSNSATAEEIARALENLRSIAAMLAGDMQKFKTTDDQELHGKTGEKRRQE
jgi:methyl-accepting chemotaxis protein